MTMHGGYGVTVPIDSPHGGGVAGAEAASGKVGVADQVGRVDSGGGLLKNKLGIDTIFMGFGLDDDRVHSPNEKFELACFRMGARSHALFMDELRRP
jgi:acetylornithine deacetylase/succinyl-diaminopimelate desuccinylase-like protein